MKNKAKAMLVLYVVIVVVMFTNFADRKDYDDLDRTISSIYSDRLVPAGYLFKINDHLYQKKLLIQNLSGQGASAQVQINHHNAVIAGLMKEYETTYLTKNEKEQWVGFKKELQLYNHAEWLHFQPEKNVGYNELLFSSFNQAIHRLQQLNDIQASEGKVLQRHSREVIGDTRLHAWLEIALLFILCIALLAFSGFNEKNADTHANQAALN